MPNVKIKCVLTIFSVTFPILTMGQNLVPNYSFEIHDTCPPYNNKISFAVPWFSPTYHSPDYHNVCATSAFFDVPQNFIGNQYARTRVAYAGIGAMHTNASREYIGVKLTDTLTAGEKYCVQFYVSLGDSCKFATDDIGAYLSVDSVFAHNTNPLPYMPQIENDSGVFLTSKTDWTLVSGQFTASGGEKFLVIGNFKDNLNTDTIRVAGGGTSNNPNWTGAYYYIDDVSVTACDTITGFREKAVFGNFKIYPNPATQYAILDFDNSLQNSYTLTLYNTQGVAVRTITNIVSDSVTLERGNLPSGLYFFQLSTDGQAHAIRKVMIE